MVPLRTGGLLALYVGLPGGGGLVWFLVISLVWGRHGLQPGSSRARSWAVGYCNGGPRWVTAHCTLPQCLWALYGWQWVTTNHKLLVGREPLL